MAIAFAVLQPSQVFAQVGSAPEGEASQTPPTTIDPANDSDQVNQQPLIDNARPFNRRVDGTFFFENDGSFVKPNDNSDRHYTSGQGFHVGWPVAADDKLFSEEDDPAKEAAGITLVQQIFTPENISIRPPDPTDRPYAGYLYSSFYYQIEKPHTPSISTLDHIELQVGVVGESSGAEGMQKYIHDIFDEVRPEGWDSQLKDELAVQLNLRRHWRIELLDPQAESVARSGIELDLLPEVTLDVGTVHRRVGGGALLRLGANLPDDFGPGRLTRPAASTGEDLNGLSQYIFIGLRGSYNEWNTFLDGNYSENPSPSVDREPWVAEATYGAAIAWQTGSWRFGFTYSQTLLTDRFENQSTDNGYGTIAFSVSRSF
jgi:hypothetical protein